MLEKLKLQYAELLNSFIGDYGRDSSNFNAETLRQLVKKMHYYSCLITDILDCKTSSDLHTLIMGLKFTDPSLHENMWILYKREFKRDTGLAAQLTAAYAVSDAQIRTARALDTDRVEMGTPPAHTLLEPERELEELHAPELGETPHAEFTSPILSPLTRE